jgi:hypothetical protein
VYYTIIPYNTTKPGQQFIFSEYSRKTTLDKADLAKIDVILEQCVKDYNSGQEAEFNKWRQLDSALKKEDFLISLADYYRQYVPIMNEENEKEVWVNAFCYHAGDKWKTEIIKVEDGGKCYFNVKINLTKGTYYNMLIAEPKAGPVGLIR